MNPIDQRLKILEQLFKNESKISITQYSGLTMDFCKKQQAQFIVRGLRNAQDFNYEQPIAQTNLALGGIETIFYFFRAATESYVQHYSERHCKTRWGPPSIYPRNTSIKKAFMTNMKALYLEHDYVA